MFEKIKNLTIENDFKKVAIAVFIADRLSSEKEFWSLVLGIPTPESFTPVGALAVRQIVELDISKKDPEYLLEKIYPILYSEQSTWSDLGISQINDLTIGSPLTIQNKKDLVDILKLAADIFIKKMLINLNLVTGNFSYSYGYGYYESDTYEKDKQYGYGYYFDSLNYIQLIESAPVE